MEKDPIYEYELVDIEFDEDFQSLKIQEESEFPSEIVYDKDGIPMGKTKKEIKQREHIIKDFYAKWIAQHPQKAVLNKYLNKSIYVKYQSINETYNKAARSYDSTLAVFKLTEILENAALAVELTPKSNKNQKQYEKMLDMRYKGIKLIVGLQKITQKHVQYSITVPSQTEN